MAHIDATEANAWAEKSKLSFDVLDSALESSVATEVLGAVGSVYDVTAWADPTSTPSLIRKVIAMKYVGWYFQRTYSEDEDVSTYGLLLMAKADQIIQGIVSGVTTLPDAPGGTSTIGQPVFYPNDASDATSPWDTCDTSVGPAKFSMGTIW